MAAITDKFNKAANGTGAYPSVASITANREQGGSVLSCDDLAGWATDTPVHFSTFRLMADRTVDTSTQSDWKGIVNGNTITQMTRIAGAADSGHLVGDKVELNPTIGWLDDLITGILKSHNQDGSLKDGVVQTKNIVDGSITEAKLADKAVTSHNVDWETMKAFVPDYANMSTDNLITGGGILTVPGNGWVSLNLNAYTFNQTEVIVKVNGKQIVDYITEIKGSNGATPNAVYGIIPVAKGDVIEISGNNPNWNFRRGYFIPGKWV